MSITPGSLGGADYRRTLPGVSWGKASACPLHYMILTDCLWIGWVGEIHSLMHYSKACLETRKRHCTSLRAKVPSSRCVCLSKEGTVRRLSPNRWMATSTSLPPCLQGCEQAASCSNSCSHLCHPIPPPPPQEVPPQQIPLSMLYLLSGLKDTHIVYPVGPPYHWLGTAKGMCGRE